MLINLVLREFETAGKLKTRTTAIAAPIKQYSTAVAPLSSFKNVFILTLTPQVPREILTINFWSVDFTS
jgi:hypothetical protein